MTGAQIWRLESVDLMFDKACQRIRESSNQSLSMLACLVVLINNSVAKAKTAIDEQQATVRMSSDGCPKDKADYRVYLSRYYGMWKRQFTFMYVSDVWKIVSNEKLTLCLET